MVMVMVMVVVVRVMKAEEGKEKKDYGRWKKVVMMVERSEGVGRCGRSTKEYKERTDSRCGGGGGRRGGGGGRRGGGGGRCGGGGGTKPSLLTWVSEIKRNSTKIFSKLDEEQKSI